MPTFITPQDVDFFRTINKEIYKLFFFPITIMRLRKDDRDEFYGEDLTKQFHEPYTIEGYIPDLSKWHLQQGKFGADENRNLRVFFSLDLVLENKHELPNIGDRMAIQGDLYVVQQVNPTDFGSNLQLPLTHVCEIIRVRPEKIEQGTVVQTEY